MSLWPKEVALTTKIFSLQFEYPADDSLLLLELCRNEYTPDLFAPEQPAKIERLVSTLDAINNLWARGICNQIVLPSQSNGLCEENCSPRPTTLAGLS